jgi:hypothetical protein
MPNLEKAGGVKAEDVRIIRFLLHKRHFKFKRFECLIWKSGGVSAYDDAKCASMTMINNCWLESSNSRSSTSSIPFSDGVVDRRPFWLMPWIVPNQKEQK